MDKVFMIGTAIWAIILIAKLHMKIQAQQEQLDDLIFKVDSLIFVQVNKTSGADTDCQWK